ncbi:amino acid transporter [Friedmanniella endophytica]|uniref:Amino acid transporter n=1 Tax=Microlunatus kandeliicorticis TaxID=1759536 RepID=A0A7W3ITA8_9ACTN|nr:APC family permease [Microlunatus kandeliicorticis]MBA8794839.1 amino acid transporter [Microlunatus kandeliicorticis]
MTSTTDLDQQQQAEEQDQHLSRSLGFWSLTAAGIGSVIGSGWLLSANSAANAAGPAALISWVIGGGLMLMIALVFAELGMVRPESGGLVRYPLYSNGRLAASVVGWAMWLTYVGNPPTEASAVVQYASIWLPGVFDARAEKLTVVGILIAVALMALFVLVNWFGVNLFAKSNNVVTAIKIFIPVITVVLLLASGFDGRNLSAPQTGGFAPFGVTAALGAIATGGLIFAYTGFRNVIELSGEARNPRRDIPRAMIGTILFTIVLYLGLQIAFLGAVPHDALAKAGWHGINYSSPFADLAKLLGLTWLSWLLIADSSLSPSGSGIVFTAANSRNVFGLAKNGFLPRGMMKVDTRRRVPVRALALNFVIGLAFLLPLPSWQSIIEVTSVLIALTFSIGSVSVMVFRRTGLGEAGTRLRGMTVIAPLAFMVSSLVAFWEDWSLLLRTIPIVAIGVIWYVVRSIQGHGERRDIRAGLWLPVHLVFLYGMASISSFGGAGLIPQPFDSIVVAVVSLVFYVWGVRSGTGYLGNDAKLLDLLRHRDTDPAEAVAEH